MSGIYRFRIGAFALGLIASMVVCSAAAPAAVDMVLGDQHLVANTPISDCNARAENALKTVLQSAAEAGQTGQWQALGPIGPTGYRTQAAAIHCFPIGDGYLVNFTCALEVPNLQSAADMCEKIDSAFGGPLTNAPAAAGTPSAGASPAAAASPAPPASRR